MDWPYQVCLSRRNLKTLLNKLDRRKESGITAATLIKNETQEGKYGQYPPSIAIIAVEDDEYYADRKRTPGDVLKEDKPS